MPDEIEDLWPEDIRINVRTPLMILQQQAQFLQKKTASLVQARIAMTKSQTMRKLDFDLVAGAADRYRVRLLSVHHGPSVVYPALVDASCFRDDPNYLEELRPANGVTSQREAKTEDVFKSLIRTVFSSSQAVSIVESLIAKSNEVKARAELLLPATSIQTIEGASEESVAEPPATSESNSVQSEQE